MSPKSFGYVNQVIWLAFSSNGSCELSWKCCAVLRSRSHLLRPWSPLGCISASTPWKVSDTTELLAYTAHFPSSGNVQIHV